MSARSTFLQVNRSQREAQKRPYLELEDVVDNYINQIERS